MGTVFSPQCLRILFSNTLPLVARRMHGTARKTDGDRDRFAANQPKG